MLNEIKDKLYCWFLHSIWNALCRRDFISFVKAANKVEKTQRELLFRLLKKNATSVFGKRHGFQSIHNIAHYQKGIPVSEYESYEKDIDEIKSGREEVLTSDPIIRLHPTSGSTAASKEIPCTRTLLREFQKGIRVWVYDLLQNQKKLWYGKAYWSITPSMSIKAEGSEILKTGFGDDLSYFGWIEKFILKHILIVPQGMALVKDTDTFYYLTLLSLINEGNLRLISVWNPMLLVIMMRKLNDLFPSLVSDLKNRSLTIPFKIPESDKKGIVKKLKIKDRRIDELEAILNFWEKDKNQNLPCLIWPKLTVISCWADGHSAKLISNVKNCFPHVNIQPKGLLATEGIVTVPLTLKNIKNSSVLSLNSHFYEFLELENTDGVNEPKIKLAHELRVDRKYKVLISTGGGLYRYNLQDIVKVTGYYGALPCLSFVRKDDMISDIMGEKLNASFVEQVLKEIYEKYKASPGFSLMAPEQNDEGIYAYTLYVSQDINTTQHLALIRDVESMLRKNMHYDYCRKLGQLEHIRMVVPSADYEILMDQYLAYKYRKGIRLGDIKHAILDNDTGWGAVFKAKQEMAHRFPHHSLKG